MIKYFNESEEELDDFDFDMSIQVAPEKEIVANMKNPVEHAKMDPSTVSIGCRTNPYGVREFFMDASDVIEHARLNEQSILESMNDIISYNAGSGMNARNINLVVDESNLHYVEALEEHGASCVRYVNESDVDDMDIDVQVGPNDQEISVSADPQEANPLDVVKKDYNHVVVAQDGNDFFTDVEDVQKCADLNCESVIDTLNGIIAANEQLGVDASNLNVICNEAATDDSIFEMFDECGVEYIVEAANPEEKYRKKSD